MRMMIMAIEVDVEHWAVGTDRVLIAECWALNVECWSSELLNVERSQLCLSIRACSASGRTSLLLPL